MIFDFKVEEDIRQITTSPTTDNSKEYCKCVFYFKKEIWEDKKITAYFSNNKEYVKDVFLGEYKEKLSCVVPPSFLNDGYFFLYVASDDDVKTNTISIVLKKNFVLPKKKCDKVVKDDVAKDFFKELDSIGCVDEEQKCNIINTIFREIDKKIDDIVYEDNKIKFYAHETLIDTIEIDNIDTDIIQEKVSSFLDNLSTKIDNVTLSNDTIFFYGDNQIINEIPLKSTSLSEVAWSGQYNDLKNIPNKFPPMEHNHQTADITDYEENVDMDLNALLDFLSDEIRKE